MTCPKGYIEDMTALLITLLALVTFAAIIFLIQRDKERILRQALEKSYDCSKQGHQFVAQYDEEFAPITENKIGCLSTSCLTNEANFNHAIRDASRIRSTYVCHVCSFCGKTINKEDQDNGPA